MSWRRWRLPRAVVGILGTLGMPATVSPQAASADTIPGTVWTRADWGIFEAKVRWGVERRLDRLPIGQAIVELGSTFVGATYLPGTLEVPGQERVVVNLRALDCVTFVENVLALIRFIRVDGATSLADPTEARRRYEGYLRDLRYRDGSLNGYPSRLHYFSEWLADNERRGVLRQLSMKLGGERDGEPIAFMTSQRRSYRQLADPDVFAAIGKIEARLNAETRWFLPERVIAAREAELEDGDIIAATSTLAGLDVAHTGFAIRRGGRIHLLHAPLVGKFVEISAVPLAERIAAIGTQDGIIVARPIDPAKTARSGR